ncbi:HoxN/HupN/NixA family nickel/cobalt transporter [Weissella diestrammenae]|uniref:Nickel/cobalt efflux system n=1 Tax=Weissella diestrammenae TaxID=1162633 RepID=A0A7G9T5X6_9LACO|nr:HoxN/HupN/NixA family nickel/cobalt transporter [Weissella diestrammenae]MCM0582331.1 HoxN/HupN/NixA family nickel/cobalt transporter [Weissella diestrammenae]QNN75501.1 HoxN/HupN/NixA family nickel/cobalt transporter [Weissella diestrammenae]
MKWDGLRYGGFIVLLLVAGILLLGSSASMHPEMIGMAILSFTFGLRHAFDIDHIAAIDNMTRKMLNDGKNTRGVGFNFSFGHSLVVILMTVATVLFVSWAKNTMPVLQAIGGQIGTVVAAVMLIGLSIMNSFILATIWQNFQWLRQHPGEKQPETQTKIYQLFERLLNLIQYNWQVMLVGFLFGLGFDTATQIAVLSTSATATGAGVAWYGALAFPLLFTAGMCLMDTLDGFFMSGAYSWIFSSAYRKVYFNLIITSISILAAGFIGLVDLIQAVKSIFNWRNPLTDWASHLDFNTMGFVLVFIFGLTWGTALLIWHVFGLSQHETQRGTNII